MSDVGAVMIVWSGQFGLSTDYSTAKEAATCGVCGAHGPVDILHILLEPEGTKTIQEDQRSLNQMLDAVQGNAKGTFQRALRSAVTVFKPLQATR